MSSPSTPVDLKEKKIHWECVMGKGKELWSRLMINLK